MSSDPHQAEAGSVSQMASQMARGSEQLDNSRRRQETPSSTKDLAGMSETDLETTADSSSSLAEAINTATRALHSTLNSSITQAMPHGLPPEAHTPALYAHGLAVFVGTVYQTFEAEWARIIEADQRQDQAEARGVVNESHKKHLHQLHEYLAHMRPAGIERTPRIQKDLSALSVDPARKPNKHTVEAKYETHIQQQIRSKPHLLLAYAWCMYMAIFAGGRYVRQALSDVPESFWDAGHQGGQSSDPFFAEDESEQSGSVPASASSKLDRPGYSFLSFDGDDDGVSIANAFRSNFAHADSILNASERCEVVQESRKIFEYCIALVHELNDGAAPIAPEDPTMTYEDAERVVDQEKRMLMQALEMGDLEDQIPGHGQRTTRSRIFLLKAVAFALVWTLFFGTLVGWLTEKTPERH